MPDATPPTPFETLLTLAPTLEEPRRCFTATLPADWMQGRSAFGGLTTAWAVRALQTGGVASRPLRSIDIAFIGPVAEGTVAIQTRTLREGKHLTHAVAHVDSGGGQVASAHATFGALRSTSIACAAPPPKPTMAREAVTPLPYIAGLTPAFTQHFVYWLTEGDLPFSGSTRGTMGGYAQLREPGTTLTVEALVALADAWPGAMLPLGKAPFPASTVRMSIAMVGAIPEGPPAPVWFVSECVVATGGYGQVVGQLYCGETLVLRTEQTVAYFDER